MTFYKDFLSSSQSKLIEQAINENIEHIKELAFQSKEESTYDSRWKDHVSSRSLKALLDDPIPHHKEARKISIKENGDYPCLHLTKVLNTIFQNHKLEQSGCFYYPKGGFMGWHTNHNTQQDRLYITYVEEDKKSFFRYYENESIITDYDNKGITIRRFSVGGGPPFFWHCVGSETDRYSFGYKIF